MTAGLDIHEARHRVELLRGDGDTTLVENRDDMACPACSDDFSQLLISDRTVYSFDMDTDTRLCVRRNGNRLLVVTHE